MQKCHVSTFYEVLFIVTTYQRNTLKRQDNVSLIVTNVELSSDSAAPHSFMELYCAFQLIV